MEKQVGIAILGLGRWGEQLAAAANRSGTLRLLSCYSRTLETRQAFAANFGCHAARTIEEALTTPGVEAALIASPSYTHLELARCCAEHRIHVFVEKAMANTYREGLQMRAEVERHGLVLMAGHEMRRLGSTRTMKRYLEQDRLGQVAMATGIMSLTGTFAPDNWRCHRETNHGGALMQLGIHQIENLIYLLGTVVEVRGFFSHVIAPADIDDVAMATLTFENGAIASVTSSYVSPIAYELHLYGEKANLQCVADMRAFPDALKVDTNTSLIFQTRTVRESIRIQPKTLWRLSWMNLPTVYGERPSPRRVHNKVWQRWRLSRRRCVPFQPGCPSIHEFSLIFHKKGCDWIVTQDVVRPLQRRFAFDP